VVERQLTGALQTKFGQWPKVGNGRLPDLQIDRTG